MQPTSLLAAIIMMAMGLAGCLSDAPEPAAAQPLDEHPSQGPLRIDWELIDCTFVVGNVMVDADRLASHLPQGFSLRSIGSDAPVDLPLGDYPLGVEAFECQETTGHNGSQGAGVYASIWAMVDPPEAIRDDETTGGHYYMKWDLIMTDPDYVATLAGHDIPVHHGDVHATYSWDADTATGQFHGLMQTEGQGAFTWEGVLDDEAHGHIGSRFREYTQGPRGSVAVWESSYLAEEYHIGVGALEVPPDSWFADVLGGERATGDFWAGKWSFTDGWIQPHAW